MARAAQGAKRRGQPRKEEDDPTTKSASVGVWTCSHEDAEDLVKNDRLKELCNEIDLLRLKAEKKRLLERVEGNAGGNAKIQGIPVIPSVFGVMASGGSQQQAVAPPIAPPSHSDQLKEIYGRVDALVQQVGRDFDNLFQRLSALENKVG